MSIIRFEIRYPDGRTEVATVDGERALIGHGAHCDIRLPIDQAAKEHVAVQVVGETVRIETKALEPAATVNGMPFATIPISPDVPLTVGQTRIYISLVGALQKGTTTAKKNEAATSPAVQAIGLLIVAVGVFYVLPKPPAPEAPPPIDLPDLFAGAAPTCEMAPDQAMSKAAVRYDIALADRERSPFVPKDGLTAVQLFESAAECFGRGGATAQMNQARSAAKELRESISLDLRARRVRLEHLLKVGDFSLAAEDVRVLKTLTAGKTGAWIDWLAGVDQLVKQKVSVASK